MNIISLNVGKPSTLARGDQSALSAMEKKPVEDEIHLTKLNFAGDAQADLVNHGGVDKAVCVYPYEHYSFWQQELGIDLPDSAFGENLTVEAWTEETACVGDKYLMGGAIVQVSQPRQPCYKLAIRLGVPDIVERVMTTGFTGFYLRVLKEGVVSKNSPITLLEKHPLGMTIAEANRIRHHKKDDMEAAKRLLAVQQLSENWRQIVQKRLKTPD